VELDSKDLINMANLLAYQLSEHSKYATIRNPQIGEQELKYVFDKATRKALNFSDALIYSSMKGIGSVSPADRLRLVKYLVDSHLVNVGTTLRNPWDSLVDPRRLFVELQDLGPGQAMATLFDKVSIAVNSPLMYTRLGEDVLNVFELSMDAIFSDNQYNDLLGKMLEIYVRGSIAQYGVVGSGFTSCKLDIDGEVDVCDFLHSLMCEVSAGKTKSAKDVFLDKYYPDMEFIRVLTTQSLEDQINGYYRRPYPKFCCELDTRDVFKLKATKAM
jgi:hypothetical protein